MQLRNGVNKQFTYPTRTIAEGAIAPYAGKPQADLSKIDQAGFFTTVGKLPTP
ncbi:hypothetical protein MAIT1_02172 [Magnetofaba australis IT-1]|uniref:Uncharacterized protein n=1 Tax=Magnetofaba australis IT-1 TaxID=1434232 RepID=A0A1Y2K379_9PROT|nr:hypothetical protein MAIT1_02172 [Magnetofaba australis IT-1]